MEGRQWLTGLHANACINVQACGFGSLVRGLILQCIQPNTKYYNLQNIITYKML